MMPRPTTTPKMSYKANMALLFHEHIIYILKAENIPMMMHRIGLLSAFMWPKADAQFETDEKKIDEEFKKDMEKIVLSTPEGRANLQFLQFQRSIQIYRALMDLGNRINLIGEEQIDDYAGLPPEAIAELKKEEGEGG